MFKLDKYGELIIDRVIFETNYPILFVCVNEMKELFLCVCCQNNAQGKRWLLTKSSEENIIRMLEDRISIREAFLENKDSQITVFQGERFEVREHSELEWGESSIYLPKKGEYMEAEPAEFDEEIAYYRKRMQGGQRVDLTIPYDKCFGTMQHFSDDSFMMEELLTSVPENYANEINGWVTHRLNVSEKLFLEEIEDILMKYEFKGIVKEEATDKISYSQGMIFEKNICDIGDNVEGDLFAA